MDASYKNRSVDEVTTGARCFLLGSRKVQHKLRIERINTTYGIIRCACAPLNLSRVFRGYEHGERRETARERVWKATD